LKSQHAAAPEFPQSGERILEAVYRAERIEFVDHDPKSLINVFRLAHSLEYCEPHPSCNH